MTPVDLNLYKTANLPESSTNRYGKTINYTKEQREDSKITIRETLINNGLNMNILKDVVEIPIYATKELTLEKFFGYKIDEIMTIYSMLAYNMPETIIKVSDYNKIAKVYGIEQYELNEDEYIVLCDFDTMMELRNKVLKEVTNTLKIAGKEYKSKYKECKPGFVLMSTNHTNTGIILVPDSCKLNDEDREQQLFIANYNANTDEEKEKIEEQFSSNKAGFTQNLSNKGIQLDGMTKISLIESSLGLATIITFIAIYLGIIFLIASSAILALKQLTESTDNKQRYAILRKIGCDEKIINRSLFRQIGIFFIVPLLLAIVHSIFGIQFIISMMSGLASKDDLVPSIISTVIIMGIIYGTYFLATYFRSKNIIKEN